MSSVVDAMRIRWMDTYRGAAILLVVLQHSTGIPRIAGIELHLPLIEAVTALLAPYRMPTLLVLSGLLLAPSLNKPLREYYDGKARKLLHPYVVWGVITAAASFSLTSIFTIEFWRGGPNHLWFLTVLMISYAFAPIGRWLRMPHLLVAAGLMATLLIVDPSTNFYRRAIFWGSLFYVGAAVRPHISRIQTLGRWFPATMGAVGIGVAIASLLGYVWVDHSIPLSALWPVPGLAALLWLGPRLPQWEWLEAVGRRSIAYYCVHAPVAILVVNLARGLAETSPLLFWTLTTAASFAVPLALAQFYGRFRWLFEFPTPRTAVK